MTISKLAMIAATAALAFTAAPAMSADLTYGSPYDDPRYSDIYRHAPPPPRYAAPYVPPPPPVYREERYVPPPPPYLPERRYQYQGRYEPECLPQQTIKHRLEDRGWFDFHDPQPAGNLVHIRARRANGRLYDVTVDRCSGQVLGAQEIHERSAYAPPPERRYRGPYERY